MLELAKIDIAGIDGRIEETEFLIACDVNNPLYGPRGAAYVYAMQKGAAPQDLPALDDALRKFAAVVWRDFDMDLQKMPGGGAAGGVGAGAILFLNGKMASGVDLVIRMTGFEEVLKKEKIDLVITGEGQVNEQSMYGKVMAGIARVASEYHIPVIVLAGGIGAGADQLYQIGVCAMESIVDKPMPLQEAMDRAYELTKNKAATMARLYKLGRDHGAKI